MQKDYLPEALLDELFHLSLFLMKHPPTPVPDGVLCFALLSQLIPVPLLGRKEGGYGKENIIHKYRERFYLEFSLVKFTGHQASQRQMQRAVSSAKGLPLLRLQERVLVRMHMGGNTPCPRTQPLGQSLCVQPWTGWLYTLGG